VSRNCEVGQVLVPLQAFRQTSSSGEAVELALITVCVCTYRRPLLLKRLLKELETQETGGLFTYSIVVVDNDSLESAKSVTADFESRSETRIIYQVEPQQSIAMARNTAVEKAVGDYVAFIDDDEFPTRAWLLTLLKACRDHGVDGVLGPVRRHFDETPPKWIIKGDFYERATYATGLVIDWRKGRTGNVLLKRNLFDGDAQPFRPEFRQGEDQDFFHRMIEKGHRFIWCNEAVAYEVVPPIRWKRTFMLKRALLRGAMEPLTPGFGPRSIMKSLVAVLIYVAVLPFAAVAGHHKFMRALISLCDHLGKLLAVVGLNPIKEQYVTE
jgi:succinoglycan biosynthesis protein ExoM